MAAQQMQKMHESTQQSIITELIRAREVGQREGREDAAIEVANLKTEVVNMQWALKNQITALQAEKEQLSKTLAFAETRLENQRETIRDYRKEVEARQLEFNILANRLDSQQRAAKTTLLKEVILDCGYFQEALCIKKITPTPHGLSIVVK